MWLRLLLLMAARAEKGFGVGVTAMPDIKAQASQWVAKQASVAKGNFRKQMERNYVWNRWCGERRTRESADL